MNSDISIMIELQHFWNLVLKAGADIERSRKSIRIWGDKLAERRNRVLVDENSVRDLKLKIKKNELSLEENDIKKKKCSDRLEQLKSEREIEAQNAEIKILDEIQDKLEMEIIDQLDRLKKMETDLAGFRDELAETEVQVKEDTESLNSKICEFEKISLFNRGEFDKLLGNLSPEHRSRFSKLINSKDGIAIAELKGEICGHCNFQIPSSIAVAVSKRVTVEKCTNCGRYIY